MSSKKQPQPDLVNIHFLENRARQGLTLGNSGEEEQVVGAAAVLDKSRKGGVDSRISSLIAKLNEPNGHFFTTSSCSGRAILFTHSQETLEPVQQDSDMNWSESEAETSRSEQTRKKGCKWLFVSHDEVQVNEFLEAWNNVPPGMNVVFKMEPCIIHVQCRDLSSAKKLVHVASQSGFRNSGMVIGKDNKITAAVRSAIGMEVPLRKENVGEGCMISSEYLSYLVETGNEKLLENWKRTEDFANIFLQFFGI